MQRKIASNKAVRYYDRYNRLWAKRNASWLDNMSQKSVLKAILWELTWPLLGTSIILFWVWRLSTAPFVWVVRQLF